MTGVRKAPAEVYKNAYGYDVFCVMIYVELMTPLCANGEAVLF